MQFNVVALELLGDLVRDELSTALASTVISSMAGFFFPFAPASRSRGGQHRDLLVAAGEADLDTGAAPDEEDVVVPAEKTLISPNGLRSPTIICVSSVWRCQRTGDGPSSLGGFPPRTLSADAHDTQHQPLGLQPGSKQLLRGALDALVDSLVSLSECGAQTLACDQRLCATLEGSKRIHKRIERTKLLLAEAGLEPERLVLRIVRRPALKSLDVLFTGIKEATKELGPSPVR